MAGELLEKNAEKKRKIKEIIEEVEDRIKTKDDNFVFEGDKGWGLILLGVTSAVISKRTDKPVFLYSQIKGECQGSVRAPEGFNTVEAMKTCQDILITFGGHPKASGFRLKKENVDKFRNCLRNYYK